MIRIVIALVFAFSIASALFFVMNSLTQTKKSSFEQTKQVDINNFIRVPNEINEIKKSRTIPKKPQEKKEPPKRPKIEIKQKTQVKNITPNLKTPKLDFKMNLANDGLGNVNVAKALSGLNNEIAIGLIPIFKVPPRYPHRAKMLKKTGYVKLQFIIDTKGETKNIKVIEANPKGFFEKSAIEALGKWKFKPQIKSGKAVEQKALQTIKFGLK